MKTTLIFELLPVLLILITALPGTVLLFNNWNRKTYVTNFRFDQIGNRIRLILKKDLVIQT